MRAVFDQIIGNHRFVAVASERTDGDIHPKRVPPNDLANRQRSVAGDRWVMVDQVHGTTIVRPDGVDDVTWPLAATGDALMSRGRQPLAVWAADCAPIALFGNDGSVAVIHAGWRGLVAGVVDAALDEFHASTDSDTTVVAAVLGPAIHACCYEFGADDLDAVAAGVHADPASVLGQTNWGTSALDVPRAVGAALSHHGVDLDVVGPCTGCDDRYFSHRARGDLGRHALVVWSEPVAVAS